MQAPIEMQQEPLLVDHPEDSRSSCEQRLRRPDDHPDDLANRADRRQRTRCLQQPRRHLLPMLAVSHLFHHGIHAKHRTIDSPMRMKAGQPAPAVERLGGDLTRDLEVEHRLTGSQHMLVSRRDPCHRLRGHDICQPPPNQLLPWDARHLGEKLVHAYVPEFAIEQSQTDRSRLIHSF